MPSDIFSMPPTPDYRAKREAMLRNRAVGDISNLYGAAKISNEGGFDLSPVFQGEGAAGFALGCDSPGSTKGVSWPVLAYQAHALTFGATRSGKGVNVIIPALLSYSGSMVCIDPKGENAWVTAPRRRQMGQRVVILDPWNEINRRYAGGEPTEQVTQFNPLSSLRADDEDFADDIAALADALIIPTPGGHDAHWTDSARELVAGLIAAEVENKPDGKASLASVRRLLTATDEELAEVVNILHERNPDGLAGRKLRRFTKSTNEVAGIRSTAETQTAILDNARLAAAMETDMEPFDLAELATGRVTLYLVLPLDRLQTHGRWLRLILTMAIRAIARQAAPPVLPVMMLLDEMGTIGKLAGVGIRLWGFLQDLNQLKRDYPDSWETFISNSSLIQVLKASDMTTTQYISDFMGTYTQQRLTGETVMARKDGIIKSGDKNYSTVGDQSFSRPLALPQELRDTPDTLILNMLPGLGNYLLHRIPYFERDEWIDQYRPMPGRKMKERPVAPSPPPPSVPLIDKERAAELAAQGLAVGKMAAGKAAGWAAAKMREIQQRQAGGAAPPTNDKEPPPAP